MVSLTDADAKESGLDVFQDDRMKDKNKPLCAAVSARTISGSDNCHFVENKSVFNGSPDVSTSILEIVPTECGQGHADASEKDFEQTEWINDLVDSTNLNKVRDSTIEFRNADPMPHDHDSFMVNGSHSYSPEIGADKHDDAGSDTFLDCDWDSIEHFDLDAIFRSNDTINDIFGNEMVETSDGFLSPSEGLVGSLTDFVPLPHAALSEELLSDEDLTSLGLGELYDAKGDSLQRKKVWDFRRESEFDVSNTSLRQRSIVDSIIDYKVDVYEYYLKPWESEEENDEKIISQELKGSWFYDIDNQKSPSNLFHSLVHDTQLPYQSPDSSLQRKASDDESIVCVSSCIDVSNDSGNRFGCSADNSQKGQFSYSHCCLDEGNQNISFPDRQRCTRTAATVKPEERNVKQTLGRQMESKLEAPQKAIRHRNLKPDFNSLTSQSSLSCSRSQATECLLGSKQTFSDLTVLEKNMLLDSPRTFIAADDNFLADRISQFQAAISKLDYNLKLAIRDSMFRLSKSAIERPSITDRSNTSNSSEIKATVDEESEYKHRARSSASETYTNPVDRTVAQLLFHTPSKFSSTSSSREKAPAVSFNDHVRRQSNAMPHAK